MLKQAAQIAEQTGNAPAAFRRLCVETFVNVNVSVSICQPPSGGCVLKP